ncbi:MAG TPA: TspO/MBR family protein [Silvibacterium sp.]|nr:TspO/MBR family protein [Silvibacterium sp.]
MATQSELSKFTRRAAARALVGWVLLCFVVAGVSSIFSAHNIPVWYAMLAKPPLNPPNWVFAPVWTTLYALMAVAVWLVWKTRPSTCRRQSMRLFCVQLWFNLLWSWIFFSRHQLGMASIDLAVLWIAILLTIVNFRKVSASAAWLMVPYLCWVTFAGYLNFEIWRLN